MKIGSDILKVYKDVHIWIGIVCGLMLFVAFYAGAITMFEKPLERWATPPPTLAAPPPLQQADALVAAVLAAHPQAASRYFVSVTSTADQGGAFPVLTDAARVVFPIFALVLAYNLVRPGAIAPSLSRLAIAAAIAQPFHAWAFGYWLPLNVLATFAVAVAMMRLWFADRRILALVVGIVASPWVDYGLAGVALTFAAWLWLRGEAERPCSRRWPLWPGSAFTTAMPGRWRRCR